MDLEAQWTSAASTAVALVTTYGLRVVGAIIILLAGWMASRIVYSAVVRLCQKAPRIDRTVVLFLGDGARYTALAFTFVAVLTTFRRLALCFRCRYPEMTRGDGTLACKEPA